MTAEYIASASPDKASEELTAHDFEIALNIARILSRDSVAMEVARVSHAYYEAEQSGASPEKLMQLQHDVKFWRTVQIDTASIPEDHQALDIEPAED